MPISVRNLLISTNLLALAAVSCASPSHTFEISNGKFVLDGKPFLIRAGEIHPSRVPKEYWRQRIDMARAMGLNTISVYLFWNMLEPEKGRFNFKGNEDIHRFV